MAFVSKANVSLKYDLSQWVKIKNMGNETVQKSLVVYRIVKNILISKTIVLFDSGCLLVKMEQGKMEEGKCERRIRWC